MQRTIAATFHVLCRPIHWRQSLIAVYLLFTGDNTIVQTEVIISQAVAQIEEKFQRLYRCLWRGSVHCGKNLISAIDYNTAIIFVYRKYTNMAADKPEIVMSGVPRRVENVFALLRMDSMTLSCTLICYTGCIYDSSYCPIRSKSKFRDV